MDVRFRYEVSHVVMNCRDPQESLRTLRALGACREHREAGETSTCCCMYSMTPSSSLYLTSDGDSTTCRSRKGMSGRLHSELTKGCLSQPSCSSDCVTPPQCSR